ncbi:hypothetical protein OAF13_02390 [Akkermansiaceae bacterium]|nr:hypothetical protein [Akkermansiaceae bacterium]
MSTKSKAESEKPSADHAAPSKRGGRLRSYFLNNIKELLIVFIGLFAALVLESYIQAGKDRKEYIKDLRALYGELAENVILIESAMEQIEKINDYNEEQFLNATENDFSGDIDFSEIMAPKSPSAARNSIWLETNRSVFENRTILSNLRATHDNYNSLEQNFKIITEKTAEIGKYTTDIRYLKLYGTPGREEYALRSRWFFLWGTIDHWLRNARVRGANASYATKRSMREIAHELKRLNINPDEFFTLQDKTSLALTNLIITAIIIVIYLRKSPPPETPSL